MRSVLSIALCTEAFCIIRVTGKDYQLACSIVVQIVGSELIVPGKRKTKTRKNPKATRSSFPPQSVSPRALLSESLGFPFVYCSDSDRLDYTKLQLTTYFSFGSFPSTAELNEVKQAAKL